MATYYVRTDGSDSNTGLGSTAALAWRSVQKAINSGGVASGDTVYVAPGTYRETAWNGQTFTSTTTFIGDPLATQFSGVAQAPVTISTRPSDGAASSVTYIGYISNFTTLQNFYWDTSLSMLRPYGSNIVISDCVFQAQASSATITQLVEMRLTGTGDITLRRCIGWGVSEINCGGVVGNTGTGTFRVESCNFYSSRFFAAGSAATFVIVNSIFANSLTWSSQNASGTYIVFNCILGQLSFANTNGTRLEDYNYYTGAFATSRSNVTSGANSLVNYGRVTNWGYFAQNGLILAGEQAPIQNGPLKGAGISTFSGYSSPATDLYNHSFSSPPDIGAVNSTAFIGASYYIPTERNASVITIPPDTTSRAVYVYLGATGLTFSTTGLAAYYTRGKAAPVAITLVTQTVTGAYASGGFVEVSSTNQPGVYRLDLPNAALVDGVEDVTVTVRGASGTNGAVLTINLLTGAVVVRMGPYQIKADGLGSSQPLDINVGAAQGIDTQVVDANGSGVDITASTLSVNVYDSGGILVATYAGTATYAADGRLTFAITTAVTGTAGTYTATITRTTSASDTQVFGPLRLYVRSV